MIKAHIAYSMMSDKVEIFIVDKKSNERFPYKITLDPLPPVSSGVMIEPSISLEKEEFAEIAAALAKAAVEVGLHKTIESANDTELRATKYHLEDMRKLVFEGNEPKYEVSIDKNLLGGLREP